MRAKAIIPFAPWGTPLGIALLLLSATHALAREPTEPTLKIAVAASAIESEVDAGRAFVASAGLARYALGPRELAKIRGGFAAANGIHFSFGLQQTTSINGLVVQNILVPVLSEVRSRIPVFIVGRAVSLAPAATIQTATSGQSMNGPAATTTVATTGTVGTVGGGLKDSVTQVNQGAVQQQSTAQLATTSSQSGAGTPYYISQSDPSITVSTVAPGADGGVGTAIQTTLGSHGIFSNISNTLDNQTIQQVTTMSIMIGNLSASVAAARAASSVLSATGQGYNLP